MTTWWLIFVEKGLDVHVHHMLEISRGLYTGGNVWRIEGKNIDLIYDNDWTNSRLDAIFSLLKYILPSENFSLREKW